MKDLKIYQENDIYLNPLSSSESSLENDYSVPVEDGIKSVKVRIEAARSGKINDNYVLYTPKAMSKGLLSFVEPFEKHLQDKHNGKAVGVIREVSYEDQNLEGMSDKFKQIAKDIIESSFNSDIPTLVRASNELIKTEEYKNPSYKGLGIGSIIGDLYDPTTISELRSKNPRKGKVSIGGFSREVYCSICGQPGTNTHIHEKGQVYNNQICFYIHNDLELDHCGFVPIPADRHTSTLIVQDNNNDNLSMDVLDYSKDPVETQMNLAELKQKITDEEAVKALIQEYVGEEDSEAAYTQYKDSLENSKPNHYLFSKESLLNIKTPVGILVGEKLIEDLEEGDEKEFLTRSIEAIKTSKNIEDTEKSLKESLEVKEDPVEEEQPEDQKVEDSLKGEQGSEYLDKFLVKLSDLLDTKLASITEAQVVKDQNEYVQEEVATLRQTLEADQTALEDISKDYRQSLIDQVVLLKGNSVSESYLEKLSQRTTDQLKATIEDLRESNDIHSPEKEVEAPDTTTTKEAIQEVEDSYKDPAANKEKDAEGKEETVMTSEESDVESTVVEDSAQSLIDAFWEDTSKMSLAEAYKKHAKNLQKFNNQ